MPIYIKMDGIKGSSTESKFKDMIEAETLTFGVSRAFSHVAGGSDNKAGDKPQFQEIAFTKRADIATPKLIEFTAAATHIAKVVISLVTTHAGVAEEIEKYELEDCLISSFHNSATNQNLGSENVSVNYTKINYTFVPRDEKGKMGSKVTTGWNLKENKKV